jgi:hypothetical protein
MTMHLAVGLTTTGKKKGKIKWASAEHKRQAEQLNKDWNDIKQKHGAPADISKKISALKAKTYVAPKVMRRTDDDVKINSLNSSWDPCLKAPNKIYSGTKMIGIAQMAKSNAVPVFNNDAVIDIARMRR